MKENILKILTNLLKHGALENNGQFGSLGFTANYGNEI